jgi:endonuclease/exonuclease/phosphatase family metal-dependent hydrolase
MAEDVALPRRNRPSRWHRPIWWLNIAAAAVLLLTYLAPHVSPVRAWWLALLAMTYPYQLLVHGLFLTYWLFFRRRRMLLSLVVVLAGWPHVADHYQLFGRNAPVEEVAGTPFKLMTWNVRLFDLYNWTGNKVTRDKIFDVLHREWPDILCLQEFFHSPDPRFFRTRDALMQEFPFTAVHEGYSHIVSRHRQHFGIATFSVYPIIDTGSIAFPDNPNNQCIWSDIVIRGDTIRLYNAHLASYHFGDEDYRFLEGLESGTNHRDSLRSGSKRILKRLRRGVRLRVSEVERIADHMAHSPHPVIYCGDMNDVPMSYSYARLREHLEDAFVNSGRGHGGTYIGRLPPLRIDHILHGPEFESWDMHTLGDALSDHRALTCSLALRDP